MATASTKQLAEIIKKIGGKEGTQWFYHLAAWAIEEQPKHIKKILEFLNVSPNSIPEENLFKGLSIGELGVIYEALLALTDSKSRKTNGQFFTPDDGAQFMAEHIKHFPKGKKWIDPCCGVGNLSWHLAKQSKHPEDFIQNFLILMDRDENALKSACLILSASLSAAENFPTILKNLWEKSEVRDALASEPWPQHDFVIVNPPYGRSQGIKAEEYPITYKSGELYAHFLERASSLAQGIIFVVPTSLITSGRHSNLRENFRGKYGGAFLYSFDNMPDRFFKDFKYGSENTSKKNQVRAAVFVSAPGMEEWKGTPILRWAGKSRKRMFQKAGEMLAPMGIAPGGQWLRIAPGMEPLWETLRNSPATIKDLVSSAGEHNLVVASTPRYYMGATPRNLARASKHTLYFSTWDDWARALIALNSSLPYWWWRSVDGGIVVPLGVLLSTPIPENIVSDRELVGEILRSDEKSLVTTLNAGKLNENVKHEFSLVEKINAFLFGDGVDVTALYAPDMFPLVIETS